MHCRMFSSIPVLYPLDASSNCFQTLSNVLKGQGQNYPCMRTTSLKARILKNFVAVDLFGHLEKTKDCFRLMFLNAQNEIHRITKESINIGVIKIILKTHLCYSNLCASINHQLTFSVLTESTHVSFDIVFG